MLHSHHLLGFMHISYTFKEMHNHYLKIFAASSNYNYSTKYILRHGKANFQIALEQMGVYLHSQLVWLPCRHGDEYDCLQCNTASTKQEHNLTCILHMDFFRNPKGNVTAPRLQEKCTPGYIPCSQLPKHPTQYVSHCNSLSAYAPGFLSSQGVPRQRGRNGAHLNLVQTCNQHTTGPGRDTWVI